MPTHNDFLSFHAAYQPHCIAIIDATSKLEVTYQQLNSDVSRFASLLASSGIQIGDRVVYIGKNSIELVCTHLACSRVGAIFVPINWRLSAHEAACLVADVDPGLVIGDEKLDQLGIPGMQLAELQYRVSEMKEFAAFPLASDRPSLILFTSGTSGKPKGAVLSERNLAESAINFSTLGRVTHKSRFLCDAPMFHVIGLVCTVHPTLFQGGSIAISGGFDPALTLKRLSDAELGITHYFCVPQMASRLRDEPSYRPESLRNLTALFTGGAPNPADNILRWLGDGIPNVDGFGMSETGTVFGMTIETEIIRQRAGSVGIATPRVSTRIVNEDEQAVPTGEPGELQLKGDNIFTEYWRNPEATKSAFTLDGWFRTGDIAKTDDMGFFYIVDRQKDMFISGGENVYPSEIEAALAECRSIKESAVIGVPDARWGEAGHMFISTHPNSDLTTDKITVFLEDRLARFKIPKHISFVSALPRNGAGKVDKNTLRLKHEEDKQ